MSILKSAQAFEKLLNTEYRFILGKKNKTISLAIYFDASQFFHLTGLHYLKDRVSLLFGERKIIFDKILSGKITAEQIESSAFFPQIKERVEYLVHLESIIDSNKTVFKYNPKIQTFSLIQADFLLKSDVDARNVFVFLSQDYCNGKYFCRSFFPQTDKDYSEKQQNWTLLYKCKVQNNCETVLFNRLK